MNPVDRPEPLEFYLDKVYPFVVYPAEEGGYVAEVEELPGCITQGETLDEVAERIEDARRGWVEVAYETGEEIPLPRTEETYSGKFVLRLPKYLHRRLSEQATKEGVSLNQYVVALLSSRAAASEIHSTLAQILEQVRALEGRGIERETILAERSLSWEMKPLAEPEQAYRFGLIAEEGALAS